ncbi:MAG: PKD domain-containing protein [Bacteroidota bacterium]
MLRLNRLTFLLLACYFHFPGLAQTTSCTADFNYSAGNNNVVTFLSKDTFATTHRWVFGDGSAALVTTNGLTTHQYLQPGKYEVKQYIENHNANCRDSVVKIIILTDTSQCQAAFAIQKIPGTMSYQFSNTSLSSSGIKESNWTFGDGSKSGDFNPAHSYPSPGNYSICLNITGNNGCKSSYCGQLQVIDSSGSCNILPQFQSFKDSLNCKKIHFINQSFAANSNIHFTWNFGDSTTSHDINPSHIYNHPGKYYVCLVSEAGSNCRKEYCDSVMVKCDADCNITAAYSYNKDSADCKKIRFTNLSISTSSNIHFTWNFGDGTTSHDINPVHNYNAAGKYYVCLVSEAGSNCRKEYCDSVVVICSTCNIITRFEKRHDPTSWTIVHFSNVSSPVNNVWRTYWSYGDGDSSRDYNSIHKYATQGTYNVCLKVISLNGCVREYCDTVNVFKPDSCSNKANFIYDSSSTNLLANFQALYQNNIARYEWDFGDGIAGPGKNPSHVYSKPGRYHVCLTVKDDQCSVTHCEFIIIAKSANDSGRIMISPNPAVNTVSVNITLSSPGQVSIRLLAGNGAVQSVYSKSGFAGNNRFTLPIDKLSQGLYFIEIRTSTGISFKRFIKG